MRRLHFLSAFCGLLAAVSPTGVRAEVHHSTAVTLGAAERHDLLGGLDYQLTIDDFQIGLEASIASVQSAYVGGFEGEDGLRLWVRIPVQVPLVASHLVAGGREGLDARLIVAPTLRYLSAGNRDAVGLGGTLGAAGHVWLHPRVSLGAAMLFPVVVDTDGQLARFPGLTVALALGVRVLPELAVGASGHVSISEGYNGDSEKQFIEGQAWVRVFFDAEGHALPSMLPTAL